MNTVLKELRLWRLQRKARKAREAIIKKDWSLKILPKVLRWVKAGALLILLSSCQMRPAMAVEVNLDIIAQIESSGNRWAISYAGAKYGRGLYQVSEIALLDYNKENNAKIAPESLFEPMIGEMVAKWYLTQRIPFFLRNKGIPVTLANILWAYSAGIGNVVKGIKPQETRNYIKRYYAKERN